MMASPLKPFGLLLSGLLVFLVSKEQTRLPGYSVINYNSDNALPQNSINDMAFDSNGFLWLATEMGMVRFDGKHFREYNMTNTPALYTNRCFLVNSVKGKILMEPGFASHRILTVTADYQLQGDSILSANPYQCNRWNNSIFSYASIYEKWGSDPVAFGGLLNRLDLNGDLVTVNERQAYVRKDSSCFYLDDHTAGIHRLTEIEGHAPKIQFMVGDIFFYIDRQNRLYAYQDGKRQTMITCSPRLRNILNKAEAGAYPMQYTVNAIRDNSHTFLVYQDNILLLDIRNGQLDFEILASGTSIRNINCIIYDEVHKTLFIGTATSGLYILKQHEFNRLFFSSDHYAINSLYAQVELPGGRILTSSGVLSRNNIINNPTPGVYDRPALLLSSDGYIWFSSYNTLKRTDTSLQNTESMQYLGSWLNSIIEAGNKDILYCSFQKLFRCRGKDTVTLLQSPALMQGADMQVIREIYPNLLWIGTTAGLFSYDLVKGTLRSLPGLEKASVRAIYKARDESIWIGTYGQGFYKYDGKRYIRMPADPGNNLDIVHCFMEDRQGYFWLPTNKGLYRVAKKELGRYASGLQENVFYYYFDKSAGFTSNEFNGGCTPCGIVVRDGYFSLPSLDGLIQFMPDSLLIELPVNPIFIERIIPDGKQVGAADQFELRQDSGPLVFTIVSPYFGNSANLHLEYSIPQLDNKWRPVNDNGQLVLTGLGKGRYTLIIRKHEHNGEYHYKEVEWSILPYWYETTWFRFLVALAAISILFLGFRFRYARHIKKAALLEQKVAERTRALSASNRVKEKMIAVILHDLRSPLRFLHIMTDHIYENFQKATRPELSDMLQKVRNATYDLNRFTQDFLVWTNAQKEGFVIHRENIVLHEIVDGIVSLYKPAAAVHNNIVMNLTPTDISLVTDPNILKLVIRNLVDNANKYTVDGEIKIGAVQDASATHLIITDTGKSMEKDLVSDIHNNTYQVSNTHHGFGYKIIMELLDRIEGKLTIDHPGKTGNRITLAFNKVELPDG